MSAGGRSADRDVERGFMVVHNHATDQLDQIRKLSAHVYALTELLVRDEVVKLDELETVRQTTHDGMLQEHPLRWLLARVHHVEHDKYDATHEVSIDCANRLPLCRAACCRLGFYLGEQDLSEGVVRWDLARPYHIKQRDDGYCVHCSSDGSCEVWKHRPSTCRTYDCRHDVRIWQDFDGRVPNPALAAKTEHAEANSTTSERRVPFLQLGK